MILNIISAVRNLFEPNVLEHAASIHHKVIIGKYGVIIIVMKFSISEISNYDISSDQLRVSERTTAPIRLVDC